MFKRLAFIILVLLTFPMVARVVWAETTQPFLSQPLLTDSHYDGQAIWFAGSWHGLILLKLDITKGQWDSFYKPGINPCCGNNVIFEKERVLFLLGNEKAFVFEKINNQWKVLAPFDSRTYLGRIGLEEYKTIRSEEVLSNIDLKEQTISANGYEYLGLGSKIYKSKNHEILSIFGLPKLFTQLLLKYRPHVREHFGYDESKYSFSEAVNGIEQSIGHMILKDGRIWFGITFYEGEGSEGVGGLGFFDLKTERFGILRAPFLLDCSITKLEFDENKLWILTNSRGEWGNSRCSGLVSYDISNGEYSTYTPPLKPYSHLTMLNFSKVGPNFWTTTSQGIIEFNTESKEWKFWAVNKVEITKQSTEVLSGIATQDVSGPFIRLGKVAKGKIYDLSWGEPVGGSTYFEIKTPFTVSGWVSAVSYKNLQTMLKAGDRNELQALSTPLYADKGLTSIIGYYIAADYKILEKRGDRIKVSTRQGWIKAENVMPMVGLIRKVDGGGIKKDIWPEGGQDIITLMLKAADSEYKAASEIETQAKVIEDKLCFIDSSKEIDTSNDSPQEDNPSIGKGQEIIKTSIFKPVCKATTGSVWFTAKLVYNMRIKTREGTFYGIPGILMELGGYNPHLTIMPNSNTDQRGKIYEASNHLNHVAVEIVDLKTKTIAIGPKHSVLLFDWIKLRVVVTQYPLVK